MPHLRVSAVRPSVRWIGPFVVAALLALSAASTVHAQTVMNPRIVSFIPSDDHAATGSDGRPLVTEYDFEVFVPGTAQPVAVVNLGKPGPSSDGNIYVDFVGLLVAPLMPGVPLEARVAAVGPLGRGESEPSNLFEFDGPAPALPTPAPSAPPPNGGATRRPSVRLRITAPSGGASLGVGQTTVIAATVSGPVSGVDFYVNGRPAGTATATPYRIRWTCRAAGRYTITAVTVDKNGLQAISSPVVVSAGGNAARSRPAAGTVAASARGRG